MRTRISAIALSALTLATGALAAGCGSSSSSATTTASSAGATTAQTTTAAASTHKQALLAPMQRVTLSAKASKYGNVLFNQDGQVVYAFEKDTKDTSNCSGECADFWPPVLSTDAPTAGAGADGGKLGTITRPDGATQVTYNGWPLYYMDEPAGEIHCQNMNMHGGLWWVVDATGNPVKGA